MKKYILSFILFFGVSLCYAEHDNFGEYIDPSQLSNWKKAGFETQVRVTYDKGLKYQKNDLSGVDFVLGYQPGNYFRYGPGVGIMMTNLKYEDEKFVGVQYFKDYYEKAYAVPLFWNMKMNTSLRAISPYFNLDIGYVFYFPCSEYAKEDKLGFFVRPSFGLDIHFPRCSIFFDLGYRFQKRNFSNPLASYEGWHCLSGSTGIYF